MIFMGYALYQAERSTGVLHPPLRALLKNAIPAEQVIRHQRIKRRCGTGGTGTVPSIILPEINISFHKEKEFSRAQKEIIDTHALSKGPPDDTAQQRTRKNGFSFSPYRWRNT
jgi:hypothetical protein